MFPAVISNSNRFWIHCWQMLDNIVISQMHAPIVYLCNKERLHWLIMIPSLSASLRVRKTSIVTYFNWVNCKYFHVRDRTVAKVANKINMTITDFGLCGKNNYYFLNMTRRNLTSWSYICIIVFHQVRETPTWKYEVKWRVDGRRHFVFGGNVTFRKSVQGTVSVLYSENIGSSAILQWCNIV